MERETSWSATRRAPKAARYVFPMPLSSRIMGGRRGSGCQAPENGEEFLFLQGSVPLSSVGDPSVLTDDERHRIRTHEVLGGEVVRGIDEHEVDVAVAS